MTTKLQLFSVYLKQKLDHNIAIYDAINTDKYSDRDKSYYHVRVQLLRDIIHDYNILINSPKTNV